MLLLLFGLSENSKAFWFVRWLLVHEKNQKPLSAYVNISCCSFNKTLIPFHLFSFPFLLLWIIFRRSVSHSFDLSVSSGSLKVHEFYEGKQTQMHRDSVKLSTRLLILHCIAMFVLKFRHAANLPSLRDLYQFIFHNSHKLINVASVFVFLFLLALCRWIFFIFYSVVAIHLKWQTLNFIYGSFVIHTHTHTTISSASSY